MILNEHHKMVQSAVMIMITGAEWTLYKMYVVRISRMSVVHCMAEGILFLGKWHKY